LPDPHVLCQAFENSIRILGEPAVAALIEDLNKSGVFLDDPEITLSKLVYGLKKILGDEAAELIAERLILKLDEMHTIQKQKM